MPPPPCGARVLLDGAAFHRHRVLGAPVQAPAATGGGVSRDLIVEQGQGVRAAVRPCLDPARALHRAVVRDAAGVDEDVGCGDAQAASDVRVAARDRQATQRNVGVLDVGRGAQSGRVGDRRVGAAPSFQRERLARDEQRSVPATRGHEHRVAVHRKVDAGLNVRRVPALEAPRYHAPERAGRPPADGSAPPHRDAARAAGCPVAAGGAGGAAPCEPRDEPRCRGAGRTRAGAAPGPTCSSVHSCWTRCVVHEPLRPAPVSRSLRAPSPGSDARAGRNGRW